MEELERWELLGDLDELNSFIGLAKSQAYDRLDNDTCSLLTYIQTQIYRILCEVSGEGDSSLKIIFSDVYFLEQIREAWYEDIKDVRDFVVPGGTQLSATLHCARTIARRAERTCIRYETREDIAMYLDRLACLLFDLSVIVDKEKNTLTTIADLKETQPSYAKATEGKGGEK